MWSRAVWLERDHEEEGVIPSSWIREGMVMWPPGVSAAKALREKKEPQDTWRRFKLIKVKHQSENFEECENHDITTCIDTDVDQESEKRQKKKKNFADFITDDHCDSAEEGQKKEQENKTGARDEGKVQVTKERKNSKEKNESLVLPTPPPKFHTTKSMDKSDRSRNFSSDSSSSESSRGTSKSLENRSRKKQSDKNRNDNKEQRIPRYRSRSRHSSSDWFARESFSRSLSPIPIAKEKRRIEKPSKRIKGFSRYRSRSNSPTQSRSPSPIAKEKRRIERPSKRTKESTRYRSRSNSPTQSCSPSPIAKEKRRIERPSKRTKESTRYRSRSNSPTKSNSKKPRYRSESGSRRRSRSKSPEKSSKKDTFPMDNAKFQKRVMFLLTEIRQEIKALKAPSSTLSDDGETLQQLTTIGEFDTLEEKLKENSGERHKLTQRLSSVGGISARDGTKKILQKVMSNDLMAKFNMKGHKGKEPFAKSQLCEIVKGAVLKRFQATEHDIIQNIAAVLKYAPDRRGGGGRGKEAAENSD
ncbi:serine/threonine-protein kinase PRP4 homolog [Saccostrea echinata]|uniref:serine/threonine-protein kinase PRP4 homolog n=1 Tax=Saccostrea echinata TaxID=191078 RepID=UPI002A82EA90|nr:serine/threonine-protein kinase PRP4 homolog [Saccostrea echinata]